MTTLHTHRRENTSLADALAAFPDAVALVYAPRWCGFARLVGGKLTTPGGAIPADAFEVRAFTPDAELRWLKNPASPDGTGTAVSLCNTPPQLPDGWNATTDRPPVTETLETTYLLWGETTDRRPSHEWGEVATARVGGIPVPDPDRTFRPKERVLLHAVEYVAADDCGSAFVFEERLTHLECKGDSRG